MTPPPEGRNSNYKALYILSIWVSECSPTETQTPNNPEHPRTSNPSKYFQITPNPTFSQTDGEKYQPMHYNALQCMMPTCGFRKKLSPPGFGTQATNSFYKLNTIQTSATLAAPGLPYCKCWLGCSLLCRRQSSKFHPS